MRVSICWRNSWRSFQRPPITAHTVRSERSALSRGRMSMGRVAASAATSRSMAATASSRTPRKESTRRMLRSSVMTILRIWRRCSPYGMNMMSRPLLVIALLVGLIGRDANSMSCVFITSCAASREDSTSVGTSPIRSSMTEPWRRARSRSARCGRRHPSHRMLCRLPVMGSCHGPGARRSPWRRRLACTRSRDARAKPR